MIKPYRLDKTRRQLILRRSTNSSLEVTLRLGVVELDRTQATDVEKPSDRLSLIRGSLEGSLGHELVGLVVLLVGEVGSEEEVDNGALAVSGPSRFRR